MLVRDIMVKEVHTASLSTKISHVAEILMKKRIHAVPVIDNDRKVLGIVTETDFFTKDSASLYLPSFIDFLKKTELIKVMSGSVKEEFSKLLEAKAEDIMSTPCITVRPDDDVKAVLKILKEKEIHSLPVTDEKNTLVGIITMADIIKLLKF